MFFVWLCMSVGVCLEALEVHLRNICQGSSVITSTTSRGLQDSSAEKDLWRSIRRREAIKRDGKRSGCGGRHRRKMQESTPCLTPLTELLARVQWIRLIHAWSIHHSVPLQRVTLHVKNPPNLAYEWICLFLVFRSEIIIIKDKCLCRVWKEVPYDD